ncbi:uncharacterized protein EDB91DRAFT_1166825 [Suillus paluster]|uniref:uncharacterized protein n=1 Tax=Suillus paluster TaxID=48578 RepID=UPI001B85F2DD|nr:uncharacterized protein EDB91DRAFT_1171936 [Suillus paluster]XP_041171224.1 uncharacterized protein EDB91DRAFT_1166825 [Suillus paluster]KAG1723854.1 hypothetical protein EDB91DRAFT_1171936 [Suillus paluster]KAG1726090.1 hypothetical protein EDB91DRAFT_1166825 [Suillus paluster]
MRPISALATLASHLVLLMAIRLHVISLSCQRTFSAIFWAFLSVTWMCSRPGKKFEPSCEGVSRDQYCTSELRSRRSRKALHHKGDLRIFPLEERFCWTEIIGSSGHPNISIFSTNVIICSRVSMRSARVAPTSSCALFRLILPLRTV